MLFHALLAALDRDHCPICHLSLESVRRFLWGFLYEGVNDPWFREELIAARGFCPAHSWSLPAFFNSATGVAIVYRHLLEEFRRAFTATGGQQAVGAGGGRRWLPRAGQARQEAAQGIRAWLVGRRPCPACREQWAAEERYAVAAAQAAADADFRARYETSLGLCLRHLASVVSRTADAADLEWLVRTERRLVERLSHELSEFWRKHDYRFHDEPMGEEGTSWRRVLHKIAGAPGMMWRGTTVA